MWLGRTLKADNWKDTCSTKKRGLCVQNMVIILGSIINIIGRMCDHLMSIKMISI
jgi:hypothetical protein